jgi:hypothetical protein
VTPHVRRVRAVGRPAGRADIFYDPPNKQVKLAGKALLAILARQLNARAGLLAPVVACSLPADPLDSQCISHW